MGLTIISSPADTLYEGGILKSRLIFPPVGDAFLWSLLASPHTTFLSEAGLPVQEFPLLPPKMIFDTEMWHPNSTADFPLARSWLTRQSITRATRKARFACPSWLVHRILRASVQAR